MFLCRKYFTLPRSHIFTSQQKAKKNSSTRLNLNSDQPAIFSPQNTTQPQHPFRFNINEIYHAITDIRYLPELLLCRSVCSPLWFSFPVNINIFIHSVLSYIHLGLEYVLHITFPICDRKDVDLHLAQYDILHVNIQSTGFNCP